jgi:Tfp pilus assembly protein PilV
VVEGAGVIFNILQPNSDVAGTEGLTMNTFSVRNKAKGFTLIEALIALTVMSFGLLAIATFQSKLVSQSGYNKARSEAIAMAQEKLDQLRSYASKPGLVQNLNDSNSLTMTQTFPASVVNATHSDTRSGINADFTRQWVVSGSGGTRNVVVNVSWVDRANITQQVALETNLTWQNPAGGAEVGDISEPLVQSATGRAHLGDGVVSAADFGGATNNGDGTSTLARGEDYVLIDNNANGDGTRNIVLTLERACDTQTHVCTDFVRITGRIYRLMSGADRTSIPAANIYVLASDAAYCSRKLTTEVTTTNFKYFDYTCYLGGGWHGNIGLLLTGNGINNSDRACVGDPTLDRNLVSSNPLSYNYAYNNWRRVELAMRRVYRGMTYIMDPSNSNAPTVDANGNNIYYSKGIADAAHLPDTAWTTTTTNGNVSGPRTTGHNFVVVSISGNNLDANACMDALNPTTVLTSAENSLLSGGAGDFVCLNEDRFDDPESPEVHPYMDTFAAGHAAYDTCPYDPSDPPALRYVIHGTIGNTTAPLTGIAVDTSDGPGNCTVTQSGGSASYDCNVYVWYDSRGNAVGWKGEVQVSNIPYGITCTPVVRSFLSTPVTSNVSGANVACVDNARMTLSGTVTVNTGNDLAGSVVRATTTLDGHVTTCSTTPTPAGGQSFTYNCDVIEGALGSGWTGTIALTPPSADFTCTPTAGYTVTTPVTSSLTGKNFSCTGPYSVYRVSGTAVRGNGIADLYTGMTISATPSGSSTAGTCSKRLSVNGKDVLYDCDLTVDTRVSSSWTGSIVISPPATAWCGSTSATSSTSVSVSTTPVTMANVSCEEVASSTVNVLIDDQVTPLDTYVNYYISGSAVQLRDSLGTVVGTYASLGSVGCYWDWANGGTDTVLQCTTPKVGVSTTWSGSFYVPALSTAFKVCPGETLPLNNLVPKQTYNYTLISVLAGDVCP